MELTPEQEETRRARAETLVNGVVSGLSAMQRTAVIEHLCGKSKTEACAIAGYKRPKNHQSRIFSNPTVQAVIADYFFGPEMGVREVAGRLGEQGRAEYSAYLVEREVPILDLLGNLVGHRYVVGVDVSQMLADGKGHLIKGVKETQNGQTIEFHDAQSALVHVGRHLGMFGPAGSTDDPLHSVGWTVEEWRAQRDRRRKEAAETEQLFEGEPELNGEPTLTTE